jgi:hypothetical protein
MQCLKVLKDMCKNVEGLVETNRRLSASCTISMETGRGTISSSFRTKTTLQEESWRTLQHCIQCWNIVKNRINAGGKCS